MSFPFLRLPLELRNKIYDLVLCTAGEILPVGLGCCVMLSRNSGAQEKLSIYVNLLKTCKAIQAEAAPVLYGANKFLFTNKAPVVTRGNISGIYSFLVKMGRRNRLHLRYLTISIPDMPRVTWANYTSTAQVLGDSFDLLALGHGLHVLELRFDDSGTQIGRSYKDFFIYGLCVVKKLKKIRYIQQLSLTGDFPRGVFQIESMHPATYIALLKENMLVGRKIEVPPVLKTEDQTIGKTVTERLEGLERTLVELASHHQDPAVRTEMSETMVDKKESLQSSSITAAQVADIVEEKLLLLQAGLASETRVAEIVKTDFKSLKEGLTAQTRGEKIFRDFVRTSVAGLASKTQVDEISKALELVKKDVNALNSRI
ncbi:hypothetical protein MMC08_000695 [Hypocenomyce scalaris]|nr:hypothetical protein [Hypocenomyce scalaris]